MRYVTFDTCDVHNCSKDENRSDATFRFKISNFSKLGGDVRSTPTYFRNLPWKIKATPTGVSTRYLGFFLECNGNSDSTTWSCEATAELRLIPQKQGFYPLTKKIQHTFDEEENNWGVSQFADWNVVVDPAKGYIKNDSVILEVWVSADEHVSVRNEAHSYSTIVAFTEDSFKGHNGCNLFDVEKANYKIFNIKRESTVKEASELIARKMEIPVTGIRLWPILWRPNQTMRLSSLDLDTDQNLPVSKVCRNQRIWSVFLELIKTESGERSLPVIDKEKDALLFFKVYDPRKRSLSYCGYGHVSMDAKTRDMIPILNKKACYPPDTPLELYEEVKPNLVEKIEDNDQPLINVLEELMDGDIIVFQRTDLNFGELPTVKDYFRDLYNRVEVTFCDRAIASDSGFTMELSMQMNYDQIVNAVGQRLGTDPHSIQIWKSVHNDFSDGCWSVFESNYKGTLKDILSFCEPNKSKTLHYYLLR